ncbi:glycosyltransferase family 2 protein [Sanguibacter inulinus]|uniref:Glycosyltransferase family 2 protein n=1 Tax=Sanguibacter inulinus TaxID=60922 RepID=A0A853ETZ7_9MICO|nr:glycosyltransferase family 2 protein [Sanguibacter inulinus]MBF0722785.1 glycosyltransferase family 2 protein [Sanguibacter inulinus]NYS93930.1 glycosyltransferase family 2 protein [Sanguibacter inulinus]
MTTISILTAVYNESLYVADMIASVLAQTHEDLELVIVDDGSTDDTVARARAAAGSDPRVVIIAEGEKLGKVGAFNRAYAESSGGAVVLLGGDDIVPPDSLEHRLDVLDGAAEGTPADAAFFRLKTFSTNPKFDGMVLPRKDTGNRSGGTVIMRRELADSVFPIDESLVAEDIWIALVIDHLAQTVRSSGHVVLNYRIHAHNSNPRHLPFDKMTQSLHRRMLPYRLIRESSRFSLSREEEQRFRVREQLEALRVDGRGLAILRLGSAPLVERLRAFSSSGPRVHALRSRLYRLFSGW